MENSLNQWILPLHEAEQLVKQWKSQLLTVVFTNGVFDLLHAGHIDYLSKASQLGDKLIVGVNSDASARMLNKGPARPVKDQNTRAVILEALRFVDAVVIFDEDTPLNLIKILQPDILVKGGDYNPNCTDPKDKTFIVGSDWVKNKGGKVVALPFLPGHSTTLLEQRILQAHGKNGKG